MFAVLHIDNFPLHAVLRTEPQLAERPAALFANTSKKSVVLATNQRARAAGVELGMTAPQAVARCPALIIRSPQGDAETEATAALLAVGFTLSPSIEHTAPGVCTVDIKGRASDKLRSSLRSTVAELAALGLPVTAGVARTPLLALYAARAGGEFPSQGDTAVDRFAVRESPPADPRGSATLRAAVGPLEPTGVFIVADEKNFLAPLPLATADPSPALAAILDNWGLRTLGDLTALPRDEIVRRFGAEGLALWQRASGGAARPLRPVAPSHLFSAHLEFENEVETLEPLLFILRRFLDRLTLELRTSQHVASDIALALRLEDDTQHQRSFRLPEPTADPEILFRTLHTHLESLQTAASICGLELRLQPTRPLVRQQGLFETGLRDPHGFAETLARVSALVGSDRVGTPRVADTHRPDAFTLAPPAAVIPPPGEPALHPALGLPLRRFRPPLSARLEFTDDRPTYLWTERVRGEIAARSVAWPSDGEWWQQDRAWQRTEWDIALAEGGVYRLILVDQAYFLEGEYD